MRLLHRHRTAFLLAFVMAVLAVMGYAVVPASSSNLSRNSTATTSST